MRINEMAYSGARPFDGYGPGFFRLGGKVTEGNVIVSENGVKPWGGYADHVAIVNLAGAIDVVLVGTGDEIEPVPAAFRAAIEDSGIGLELMATPSACRTYNVLLSEGRRIAAAVLAI